METQIYQEIITTIDYSAKPPLINTFLLSEVKFDSNNTLVEINYDERGNEILRTRINEEESFEYITPNSKEFVESQGIKILLEEYPWGYIINELDDKETIIRKIKRTKHSNGLISKEEIYGESDVLLQSEEWSYDSEEKIIGNTFKDIIANTVLEATYSYDSLERLVTVYKKCLKDGTLASETTIDKQYG